MNKGLTKNLPQTIGGVLVLIILMCAGGMFLYTQWNLKRSKESLEGQVTISPVVSLQPEKLTNTYVKEPSSAETTAPKPLTQHDIELGSDGIEIETPSLETLNSLIDELALSEVEPSEAETVDVQGENLEEDIDVGSGLESLLPVLTGQGDIEPGASEDIVIVAEILKRSLGGSIAIDDLITMIEAILRIEPDRPQLQSLLLQLQNNKEKSLQSGTEYMYMLGDPIVSSPEEGEAK